MKVNNKTVRWFYNGNETSCEVRKEGNTVAAGITTKFHKDTANKRLARDIAFRRAMDNAKEHESLTKDERKELWSTYRTTINQPIV